jgi:hypothetical protein
MKTLFLLVALFCGVGFQQHRIIPIVIKEYRLATVYPQPNERKITKEVERGFIKIDLYDRKGKMYLRFYSRDSVLLEEGNYQNSLALLRRYCYGLSPEGENDIAICEYYEPLRTGKWLFYDSTGKLQDSIWYIKGTERQK